MKIFEVISAPKCQGIFSEVQKFTKSKLDAYIRDKEQNGISNEGKDIFDFVWKTISLSAAEVCILDSPLLQRLRKIKQLGLASLVYCNADYSRFSHTLGVVEISGRMCDIITRKVKSDDAEIFYFPEIVRLAAIFHDVGHLFFSHVSEYYFCKNSSFPKYSEINEAIQYFGEITSLRVSLHELLSIMIVNSPSTKNLLRLIAPLFLKTKIVNTQHIDMLTEYISAFIIGIPIDKKHLPYHSVINGAIDADKLDYYSRDSEATKVPIAVDIARLIQKIEVVDAKEDFIKKTKVWNDYKNPNHPVKIMGIKFSAQRVFWQLTMARTILYESIYYHHKVLTAEEMLRQGIAQIVPLLKNIEFSYLLTLTDDCFSCYFTNILKFKPKQKEALISTVELINRIECRALYKRVVSFSQDNLQGKAHIVKNFIRDIINNVTDKSALFIDILTKEYLKVRGLLGFSNVIDKPLFLFVESKSDSKNNSNIVGVPIEFSDGSYEKSQDVFKDDPWMRGKENKVAKYYLVTDQKDRDLVFLTLEKILFKEYGLRILKGASMCAKFNNQQINERRFELFEIDFYKDALILLDDSIFIDKAILINGEVITQSALFLRVVDKFQSYLGVDNCKVTHQSLACFLKQFLYLNIDKCGLELLIDGILRLLDNATFIDRPYFVSNCETLLMNILDMDFSKKYLLKLGGLFDSANKLTYYFNDVVNKGKFIFSERIEDMLDLIEPEDAIIFFDDGAYSGKQVVSIFQEMMGVSIEKRTTNEHHIDELSKEQKEKLCKTNIVLAYLCFNQDSEKYIISELKKIGILNVNIVFCNSLNTKLLDVEAEIFASGEQCELVKNTLAHIGENVLLSTKMNPDDTFKDRWDSSRIKSSALGYNDAQQMVVFESNVPTYTITPFWSNGLFMQNIWRGLFQRTKKD